MTTFMGGLPLVEDDTEIRLEMQQMLSQLYASSRNLMNRFKPVSMDGEIILRNLIDRNTSLKAIGVGISINLTIYFFTNISDERKFFVAFVSMAILMSIYHLSD